jgi:hypothetical protein
MLSMWAPPSWVDGAVVHRPLDYVWDDTRASADFSYDAAWLPERMVGASIRAQLAMCVGLYEQVVWRIHACADVPLSRALAAAAWCGTLDPRYLPFFELDRREWRGPALGPLWCAATWLQPAIASGDHLQGEVVDALDYLARLAHHISAAPDTLEHWMRSSSQRLVRDWPVQDPDPFADPFNHDPGRHRGPIVPRSALDVQLTVTPAAAWREMLGILQDAHTQANPFLPDEDELADLGLQPGNPELLGRIAPG